MSWRPQARNSVDGRNKSPPNPTEQKETMTDLIQNLHPVVQALMATCFTWALTALGAATVFTAKDMSRKVLDAALG